METMVDPVRSVAVVGLVAEGVVDVSVAGGAVMRPVGAPAPTEDELEVAGLPFGPMGVVPGDEAGI